MMPPEAHRSRFWFIRFRIVDYYEQSFNSVATKKAKNIGPCYAQHSASTPGKRTLETLCCELREDGCVKFASKIISVSTRGIKSLIASHRHQRQPDLPRGQLQRNLGTIGQFQGFPRPRENRPLRICGASTTVASAASKWDFPASIVEDSVPKIVFGATAGFGAIVRAAIHGRRLEVSRFLFDIAPEEPQNIDNAIDVSERERTATLSSSKPPRSPNTEGTG